jgi:hypothetical protein
VFGYGSLAAEGVGGLDRVRRPEGFVADLEGWARGWGVAMDNTETVAGYKCYVDGCGARPEVFVAFLDIMDLSAGSERRADAPTRPPAPMRPSAPASGGRVNGVCVPVDAAMLARLDARERNYDRVDVSDRLGCGAPVWTYVGSAAGRARLAQGRARGTAVIHQDYLTAVTRGFQALGAIEWAACAPSLEPGGLPLRALVRRDLP